MNLRVLALAIAAVASMEAQVTFERLLHADREPQNWMTFGGTYSGRHYSLLTQITPDNAKDLEVKWVFPVRSLDAFETTPLVVDGVLYTMQANDVFWIVTIAILSVLAGALVPAWRASRLSPVEALRWE